MSGRLLIGLGLLVVPASVYAFISSRQTETDAINFQRPVNEPISIIYPEDYITVNPENIKTTSARGRQLIKNAEGLRLEPYQDVAGYWTIGYGHLIRQDESFTSIDETEADTILAFDLNDAENCITNRVSVTLNQNQFDALVSFVFNVGCSNFTNSTLLKKLNAGDFEGAANEFKRWRYAGGEEYAGLIARREHEKNLFIA